MDKKYIDGISVLITFYNQERYVNDCLESVLLQKTTFDFDILIGDDGSTDNTRKIVKKWIEKHPNKIFLFKQERNINKHYNSGVRASQNRINLIRKVIRKYFIYLDGDDYYTDVNKLQIQYDQLEKNEHSDCIGCAHSVRVYNENQPTVTKIIPNNLSEEGEFDLKKYWKKYYFHSDSILFRSSYIPNLKFNLVSDSFNDNMITYSMMQFGDLLFLNKCMVDYRQNNNGIWAGQSELIGVIRNIMAYDLEKMINSKYRKQSMVKHFGDFRFVMDELRKKNNVVVDDLLQIAIKNNYKTVINISQGYIFSKNKYINLLMFYVIELKYILTNFDKVVNKFTKKEK